MSESIRKKYEKDGVNIYWEPKKCIHSAVCVKGLPKVFRPSEKPWMHLDEASIAELKMQIDACPSGALSYEDGTGKGAETTVAVTVMKGGPLLMKGSIAINHADGRKESKNKTTAFCRCGASSQKPYCDGTHNKITFEE